MVLVKLKRDTYGAASDYLRKSLEYIYNPEKAKYIGGFGVSIHDAETTQQQMEYVKHYFHRTADNPLIHLIVSFPKEVKTLDKAIDFARLIGFYFKYEYQIIWCVHYKAREKSLFHVHYIINPVSFHDGRLFNSSRENMADFCEHVNIHTGLRSLFFFADSRSTDDL